MFRGRWTPKAQKEYERLQAEAERVRAARESDGRTKSSRQEGLFKQVHKTIQLLLSDPRHPGLRTHPYQSLAHPFDTEGKVFEAYVQRRTPAAYRGFWCYGRGKGEITIIAITPHP